MSYYIMYDSDDTPEKKKYLNWLAKVTNKKSGKFNQVADLKARELIPEEELSEHEGTIFPYRKLDHFIKSKLSTVNSGFYDRRHPLVYGHILRICSAFKMYSF